MRRRTSSRRRSSPCAARASKVPARHLRGCALAAALSLSILGCAAEAEPVREAKGSIVYGSDDRKEYFAVADPAARATMSESMVAVVSKSSVRSSEKGFAIDAPSWKALDDLCPGEPFADQPAAAFCTGVLVDWD